MYAGGLLKRRVVVLLALSGMTFAADPKAKHDARAKQKDKPFPLSVCFVTDEKLGQMGQPHGESVRGRRQPG